MDTSTQVLSKEKMRLIISRLAYEIYEQHFDCERLILAAVTGNGEKLAKKLLDELKLVGCKQASLSRLKIDKQDPVKSEVALQPETELSGAVVVVVDDVLNSGKTLMYALRPLLRYDLLRLQVAVLVDRGHHQFPVGVNFCGYQLATTLQEHIRVSFEPGEEGVYLH